VGFVVLSTALGIQKPTKRCQINRHKMLCPHGLSEETWPKIGIEPEKNRRYLNINMSSKWELKLQEWGLYYGIFVIQLEKKS
jgi:hypothetical protein